MDDSNSSEECRIFSERLEKAFAAHPEAPGRVYGRNVWLAEKMAERDRAVTTETVRRWFAGIAMPRYRTLDVLADLLDVDPRYLKGRSDDMAPGGKAPLVKQVEITSPLYVSSETSPAFLAANFIEAWGRCAGLSVHAEGRQLVFQDAGWRRRVQVVALGAPQATILFPDMGGTLTEALPHAVLFLGARPSLFVLPSHLVESLGGPGGSVDVEVTPNGLVLAGTKLVLQPLEKITRIFDLL